MEIKDDGLYLALTKNICYLKWYDGHGFCVCTNKPREPYKKIEAQEWAALLEYSISLELIQIVYNNRWFKTFKIIDKTRYTR